MTYRIYLCDDDKFLLDLYALKFKNAGHTVTTFSGGPELLIALRKAADLGPDALLLDVIMPEMDGFAVLETIRAEKLVPKTKILILSNQGQAADLEKATSLGASGYIIKASAIPSEVLATTVASIEGVPHSPLPS